MARRARILPFPVPYPQPEDDRRLLWLSLALAALLHLGLLFLPVPWDDAEAAAEPPPRVIHRLVTVRPPEPEPPPPAPPEDPAEPERPREPIPVPEPPDFEPPPEAPAALPPADLEALAELPVLAPPPGPPPVPEAPPEEGLVYVVGEIQPPEAVFAPRPLYPRAAHQIGKGGTVIVQATIDKEGRVTEIEVLRPAPLGMTEAAVEAVRQWRFRPATLEDRPVAVYYHLTVRFDLVR